MTRLQKLHLLGQGRKLDGWMTRQLAKSDHPFDVYLPTFEGGCAIMSYLLYCLTRSKIQNLQFALSQIFFGSHVFLLAPDGCVVDKTYKQFDNRSKDSVVILKQEYALNLEHMIHWKSKEPVTDLKRKMKTWPDEQNPFKSLPKVPEKELARLMPLERFIGIF